MKWHSVIVLYCATTLPTLAQTGDPMGHKPGLWENESRFVIPNCPIQIVKVRVCMDGVLPKDISKGMDCERSEFSHDRADLICRIDGTRVTGSSTVTWTGDSAYHADITLHADRPTDGFSEMTGKVDAHWEGPCPAGMKPGDHIVVGGGEESMPARNDQEIGPHP